MSKTTFVLFYRKESKLKFTGPISAVSDNNQEKLKFIKILWISDLEFFAMSNKQYCYFNHV